ncbi:MAG: UDP-N-acetylglucosamine 2-epimerase [Desulfobacteraceae bacterium]|jgi:UDP-N-acetylglucosamine 2-epimerase (non-hydrolysing)/GDP/UDP-N,N'-diacetylbacillosamine 2-epimerase (hydrolysing)
MRKVGMVTVARSDYSYYRPLLRRIQADPALELDLIVAGMHLSQDFGYTVKAIEEDGFPINERVEMLLHSDTPSGISKSMGLGTLGFAQCFENQRPDLLLLLGDFFAMHAAAVAAVPFRIPLAHMHGGEVTEGAMDDALRHSITKMSHLHFVATTEYARRVVQMGEEPWRVTVSGAPSLDNLKDLSLLETAALAGQYGLDLSRPPLLVSFHPVTLESEQTEWQTGELLAALEACGLPVVFSLPNADAGNQTIRRMIQGFIRSRDSAFLVDSFGTTAYFSLMAVSAAMVGNSSSGIIEAASFRLPVVNVGTRQEGRVRGRNVIDTAYDRKSVLEGIQKATHPQFREDLKGLVNPYGEGKAADTILQVLKTIPLDDRLIRKKFHDMPRSPSPQELEEGVETA